MADTKPAYRWKITKDHTSGNDKGAEGPAGMDETIKSHPARFSMYDDDGNCCYEGMLYGDCSGFEPLWDFGVTVAGCTRIRLDGKWL